MSTVKVFKTTVCDQNQATSIRKEIRRNIPGSDSSFDLEDEDKVLRIENPSNKIDEAVIRRILRKYGYSMDKLL